MQVAHNGIAGIGNSAGPGAAVETSAASASSAGASLLNRQRAGLGGDIAGGLDTATLSSVASLLSKALTGESEQPSKVGSIAAAVSSGSYQIDPDRLASSLMHTMLQSAANE